MPNWEARYDVRVDGEVVGECMTALAAIYLAKEKSKESPDSSVCVIDRETNGRIEIV